MGKLFESIKEFESKKVIIQKLYGLVENIQTALGSPTRYLIFHINMCQNKDHYTK